MEGITGSVTPNNKGRRRNKMALKKGKKIWSVTIEKGIVKAYTRGADEIPLTRSQRKVLSDYKNHNYIENICREFSHKEPVDRDFSVMKDGTIVFQLEK